MGDITGLRRYRGARNWERPDPPRLNDTEALRRKGLHPYELVLRGEEIVSSSGRWTSPLETAWNPEHAFNGRSGRVPQVAVSPNYGAGGVIAIHTAKRSVPGATPNGVGRGNPAPDRNGRGGRALREAIDCCIPKG